MQSTLDGKVIRLWAAPAAARSGEKWSGEEWAGAKKPGVTAPRHDIPAHLRLTLPTRLVEDAWWLAPPVRTAQVLAFPAAACREPQSNVVRLRRQTEPRS